MKRQTSSLGLATRVIASNIWLLNDAQGRRFLIDSGHAAERGSLKRSLRKAGVRTHGDLQAVLLTHRHSDHAGNAAWLRDYFDCPVFCHPNDAPVLSGYAPAPRVWRGIGNPIDHLFCYMEDHHPARLWVDDVYDEGHWRWGFHVFPAFGHTEGSVLLYHEPTQVLFTGDALLTGIPPMRRSEVFQLAFAPYSIDRPLCHRLTLDLLADPPPLNGIASGHGPYVFERIGEKLAGFVQEQRQGVPA